MPTVHSVPDRDVIDAEVMLGNDSLLRLRKRTHEPPTLE